MDSWELPFWLSLLEFQADTALKFYMGDRDLNTDPDACVDSCWAIFPIHIFQW